MTIMITINVIGRIRIMIILIMKSIYLKYWYSHHFNKNYKLVQSILIINNERTLCRHFLYLLFIDLNDDDCSCHRTPNCLLYAPFGTKFIWYVRTYMKSLETFKNHLPSLIFETLRLYDMHPGQNSSRIRKDNFVSFLIGQNKINITLTLMENFW